MIKWFCDVCGFEITAPMCPVRVAAYRCSKGRDDADIGWSENDDIIKVFCHEACADELENQIKVALATARALRMTGKE